MQKDILYIVIPAYNEEENIARVIEDWYLLMMAVRIKHILLLKNM